MLRTGRFLALLCCLQAASAYYLPGTYPQEFLVGDVIQGEEGRREQGGVGLGDCFAQPLGFCPPLKCLK